jgi:hypothetical protein
MKKLLLIAVLAYGANSSALNLNDLHGCFETIDVNGRSVNNGPILWRNQSQLETLGNRAYKDIDTREDISISSLTLFQGFSDPYYNYNPFVILHDRGELIEEENSLRYKVDYDFLLSSYGIYKKVDHYLDLNLEQRDGIIYGSAHYISKVRNHNRRVNFTLRKETCISDD